jgi:DNA-binding LacI/PurR family transcriptional regulator
VFHCECSLEGGRKAARSLLFQPVPPTAFVAMSDIVALGAQILRGPRYPDSITGVPGRL